MSELEILQANWLSSFRSSVAGATKELANASSRIRVQGSSKLRSCIQWKNADKKSGIQDLEPISLNRLSQIKAFKFKDTKTDAVY